MQFSEAFIRYMEEAIGYENAQVAFSAFDREPSVSVRANPFKHAEIREGRPVAWNRHGRMLDSRPSFTLDPLFHSGAYYVQDSSSMFVGHVFRTLLPVIGRPIGRPLRVLDLCAAPGGKTTDLAASLREICSDSFLLVANEVMKARAGVLADNVALWGDPNVVVTSDDPKSFAALPGFFDVIVADVPCSGEGMFRKDEKAVEQWSEDNVALCEARQRRIVADVWPALAEGGLFIYSTCTFNRRENDGNVRWISEELGADMILEDDKDCGMPGVLKTRLGYSLVPGFVEGEGQYCSALKKTSAIGFAMQPSGRKRAAATSEAALPASLDVSRLFDVPVKVRMKGTLVTAVPHNLWNEVTMLEGALHVLSAGCAAGTVKGRDFIPDPDLALSIKLAEGAYMTADVDRETALKFLHKDSLLFPDREKGILLLKYKGVSLGFVKNLGNRCNNLHPQGRRIRMDIR